MRQRPVLEFGPPVVLHLHGEPPRERTDGVGHVTDIDRDLAGLVLSPQPSADPLLERRIELPRIVIDQHPVDRRAEMLGYDPTERRGIERARKMEGATGHRGAQGLKECGIMSKVPSTKTRPRKRGVMRITAIVAVAASLTALAPPNAMAQGRALLSLLGLPIASGQYISGFHIDTWSVGIVAVCQVPSGWSITATNQGGPGGLLEGQGQIGGAFVQTRDPPEFKSLFLVDVDQTAHKAPQAPPTFAGTINVGRYGADGKDAVVALKPVSYRLTSATRCPKP